MHSISILLVALSSALLAGCDTMHVQQYRITGAKESDRAEVKRVLHRVASQTGLVDLTSTSPVAHTLVLYMQPKDQAFRVELGARTSASDILIDLNGGFSPASRPEFGQAKLLLTPALQNEFGSRLTIAPSGQSPWPIPPH